MDICIRCGKEKRLLKRHKWRKLNLREKLKFWRRIYIGYCFECWVKEVIQVRTLFKSQNERFRVYLEMCDL